MDHVYVSNSYQIRKLQNKRKKRRLVFFIVITIIIVLGIVYEIIFSPTFQIKKINISQTNFVKQEEISQEINNIFNSKKLFSLISIPPNLLFFNSKDCQKIKHFFFSIDSINCKKNFSDKSLNINLTEKIIEGKFCPVSLENDCFYFNKDGLLFLLSSEENNNKTDFIIKETSGKNYSLGDKIIDNFNTVLQIKDFLAEKISLPTIEINNYDIIYSFANNFQILISKDKIDETIVALPYIWNNSFLSPNLKYIDLRFLPKIYYK